MSGASLPTPPDPRGGAGLPSYDELPAAPDGGRSGWGAFGPGDQLGLVNLMTGERVAAAARLVRRGALFPLDVPGDTFVPPLNPARGTPRHHVVAQPGGIGFDDVWDNIWPQSSSQWDSLAHIGYSREVYYNGATPEDVTSGRRNTVDRWGDHGMAGRAVLLDIPAAFAALGRDYDPAATVDIDVPALETARAAAGVDYEPGDILLLHTGFGDWYRRQSTQTRKELSGAARTPGLEHSEQMCRYVWDSHASAIASDNLAVESWPADTSPGGAPFGFLHQMLIGSFGMALGELWWLHDLATDCRETGVYVGLLVSAPTRAPGGIASAANAVVLK